MSDVFAADRVIWVEGPTEELCFPYLYQNLIGPLPRGTIITAVVATGDFNANRRNRTVVYDIYKSLTTAAASLVVAVAFSFDTEKLADSEKDEMRREAGGSLHFLPRRHLECYLVDPGAIAAFIVSKDPASAGAVTPEIVEECLKAEASKRALLISEWSNDVTDERWLTRVDAANLIKNVCAELSESRAPFAKKRDSLFLLQYILAAHPDRLAPLKDYITHQSAIKATN